MPSEAPSACSPADPTGPVVVAKNFIKKGTLGTQILRSGSYQVASVPCAARVSGAFGDPRQLRGLVAVIDIFPGMQLSRLDFSGVLRVSLTTPVRAGTYAALTVTVTPPGRCTIAATYRNGTRANGLHPKTGRRITWRWKVASSTPAGRGHIVVRCGTSGTLRLPLQVVR